MSKCHRVTTLSLVSLVSAAAFVNGQTAGRGAARQQAAPAAATVQQVMRGILFPNSNVIFAAQSNDPEKIKKAPDPSVAPNPLESVYGGWEAVANSGIVLSEAARLLEIPRKCSNGNDAPIQSATWKLGLTQLRAAGRVSYDAAQAKSQDKVLDASDKVSEACATCHDKFREKTPRCIG
jgi:hypothetical protein